MRGPVAIVGMGLMGGSVARALQALPAPPTVLGIDPDPLQGSVAREAGAISLWDPSGEEALPRAATVVYATPLPEALRLLELHAPLFAPAAWVTDVVSLKAPLLRRAEKLGIGDRFVGSHPLAGGEGSGFRHARADLFQGARVYLAAGPDAPPALRREAGEFWAALGGIPEWIDAEEHDHRMAWVSHLPQLVSNALAGAIHAAGYTRTDLGPGGRDMTRLAAASPEMWAPLLESSAPAVGAGLTSVSRALNIVADLLARREVDRIAEFMERTREWTSEGSGDEEG